MVKKKTQKNFLIFGIIAIVLILGYLTVSQTIFGIQIFTDTETEKYHYAGKIALDPNTCNPQSIFSENDIEFTEDKIASTDKSNFRIVVTDVQQLLASNRGATQNPSGVRALAIVTYKAEVYHEGKKIETLDLIDGLNVLDSTTPNPGEQKYYRAYSDSGKVYKPEGENQPRLDPNEPTQKIELPDGETGINVVFGYREVIFNAGRKCGAKQPYIVNKYEIVNVAGEVTDEEIIEEEEQVDEELPPTTTNGDSEEQLEEEKTPIIAFIFPIVLLIIISFIIYGFVRQRRRKK